LQEQTQVRDALTATPSCNATSDDARSTCFWLCNKYLRNRRSHEAHHRNHRKQYTLQHGPPANITRRRNKQKKQKPATHFSVEDVEAAVGDIDWQIAS
jgi:hypothetical protein